MNVRRTESVRDLLRRHGIVPSKGLGQNFVTDVGVLGRVVAACEPEPSDLVLEVGPGLGTLTRRLAEQAITDGTVHRFPG